MWKRSKDEAWPERETEAPAEVKAERVEPGSAITPSPRPTQVEARIGKSTVIKGQIFSQEDILLDGEVEGTLDLPANRLTVGQSAKVQATIRAREVEILGTVHGNIEAGEKVTIRRAANLIGDLKSAAISIEDGAYFKGSIDIVRPVSSKAIVSAPAGAAQPPPVRPGPAEPKGKPAGEAP